MKKDDSIARTTTAAPSIPRTTTATDSTARNTAATDSIASVTTTTTTSNPIDRKPANTSTSSINLTSNLATLHLSSKENVSSVSLEDELPSAFFSSDFDFEEPVVLAVSPAKDPLKAVKAPDYAKVAKRAAAVTIDLNKKATDSIAGETTKRLLNNAVLPNQEAKTNALPSRNLLRKVIESSALNTSLSTATRQQQQSAPPLVVPSTPPRKPMTAPFRSLEDLRREKARLSDQICDLLDADDEDSLRRLKELKEKRKQIEAEINNYPEDTFLVGETQFSGPLNTIPETPLRPALPSTTILQTPHVISNTSISSTPGPTQLSDANDVINERWSNTNFPWSRDVKKALNS